jgi:hypothetical protein
MTDKSINIVSSHIVTFYCMVRVPEIYSLSKLPVYNIEVLITVTMLYIRS